MSIGPGTKLGTFEVVRPLGAGGMGEVYRARDTKLGRDVALKLMPESFIHDAERVARFRREAQVLALLNHPHIASIHGLEEADGAQFLVLELVEGETLASRIGGRGLPIDEAIAIAKQVAEALEAAHERGIIHRDLKPANIALTHDGQVKVLDFGLAKALDPVVSSDVSMSPTLTFAATQAGVILGTAAYMSPEQAKGRVSDKRTDVWAFGCVLYEMLTGRRAFEGEDVSETLATVLKTDPDWSALPPGISPAIRALLEGCLKRDRTQRIGDVSTARFVLNEPRAVGSVTLPSPPPPRRAAWLPAIGGLAAGLVVAMAAAWFLLKRPPPATPPVTRFAITLPQGQRFQDANRDPIAISPDGTKIAFVAGPGLYLRSIGDLDSQLIAGVGVPVSPAFSPNGDSIVYYDTAATTLKRIGLAGGSPVALCQTASAPVGIVWSSNGILFALPSLGIFRVSENGGTPEPVVPVKTRDDVMISPSMLPDGDTLMFTFANAESPDRRWDNAQVMLHSLRTGTSTMLFQGGSDAHYVESGHIVYMVGGTMMAVPFDVRTRTVKGSPTPIVQGIRRAVTLVSGSAYLAIASNGTLAYLPGPAAASAAQQTMALFDERGAAQPLNLPPGAYAFPRVSPDGKRVAFETQDAKDSVIWTYDLDGSTSVRRLTFGGDNRYPVWSADSKRVVFQSNREGDRGLFWQPADGGVAERLTKAEAGVAHVPESWSPNGEALLLDVVKRDGHMLSLLSMRDRKVVPWGGVEPPLAPTAVFSPDGRWVAYQSFDVTGPEFTYVQPFPATGAKYQIGRGGRPMWSPDGKQLFFVPGPGQLSRVTIATQPAFTFTAPVPVPRGFGSADPAMPRTFDIARDGRILGLNTYAPDTTGAAAVPQLNVVVNWFEELKTRVPAR